GILIRDRLDAVDDLRRRTAEPGLLRDPVAQRGHPRGRPGRTPGAPVFVRVAYESERRKPLKTFIVRGLEPAERFLLVVRAVVAGAPDHALAEPLAPHMALARRVIGAHDVIQNLLAVERHHRLEAIARHQVDGLAAGDRHPDVDRQVLGPGNHGDLLEAVAAVVDRRWTLVVLALVMEGVLVEALEQELE